MEPPFDLQLVMLLRREELSVEEANAVDAAVDTIRASLDPARVRLDPDVRLLTDEQMSVAEYFATRPLFLEYLTYRGEESQGVEPFGRA